MTKNVFQLMFQKMYLPNSLQIVIFQKNGKILLEAWWFSKTIQSNCEEFHEKNYFNWNGDIYSQFSYTLKFLVFAIHSIKWLSPTGKHKRKTKHHVTQKTAIFSISIHHPYSSEWHKGFWFTGHRKVFNEKEADISIRNYYSKVENFYVIANLIKLQHCWFLEEQYIYDIFHIYCKTLTTSN